MIRRSTAGLALAASFLLIAADPAPPPPAPGGAVPAKAPPPVAAKAPLPAPPEKPAASAWEAVLDEPFPLGFPPTERTLPDFLRGLAIYARETSGNPNLRAEADAEAAWELERVAVPDSAAAGGRFPRGRRTYRGALDSLPEIGLSARPDGDVLRIGLATPEEILSARVLRPVPFSFRVLSFSDDRDPRRVPLVAGTPGERAAVRSLGTTKRSEDGDAIAAGIRAAFARGGAAAEEAVVACLLVQLNFRTLGLSRRRDRRDAGTLRAMEQAARETLDAARASPSPALRALSLWREAAESTGWRREGARGDAFAPARKALDEQDPRIRIEAFRALALLLRMPMLPGGDRAWIAARAAAEKDPNVLPAALPALGAALSNVPSPPRDALGEAAKGGEPAIRRAAARGIAAALMGGSADALRTQLLRPVGRRQPPAAGEPQPGVAPADSLRGWAISRLEPLLRDPDSEVRRIAAEGLSSAAWAGDARSFDALKALALDAKAAPAARSAALAGIPPFGTVRTPPPAPAAPRPESEEADEPEAPAPAPSAYGWLAERALSAEESPALRRLFARRYLESNGLSGEADASVRIEALLKAPDDLVRREAAAWMPSGGRWRDRDPERQARIAAALEEAAKDPILAGHALAAVRGMGGGAGFDGVVDQVRRLLPSGEVPVAFGRLEAIAALARGFQPAGRRGRRDDAADDADGDVPVLLARAARLAPGLPDPARVLAMECALEVRGVLLKPGADELAWLEASAEGKDPEAAAEAARLLCLVPADPGVKAWAAKRIAAAPPAERAALLGVLLKGEAESAALDAVTAALGKAEGAERAALAAEALRRLSGKAPKAWFDALAAGLSGAGLSQALDGIAILERHAAEPDAARLLAKVAKEGKDAEARQAALEALAIDGAAAASGLDAAALRGMAAKDAPAGIRKAALIAAAALGPEALDPILKAEILAGSRLPMEALDALAGRRQGPPRTAAATRLVAALGASESAWLRSAAAEKIRGVYEGLPEKERGAFARASVRFLADADPGVREKAADSFEDISGSFDREEDPAAPADLAEAVRAEAARIPMDSTQVLNFFANLRDPALLEAVAAKGLATTREEILEAALSALEDAMTDEDEPFQPTDGTLEALAKLLRDPYAAEDSRRNAASILARSRAPGAVRILDEFVARGRPEEAAIREEIREGREEVEDDDTPEGGAMPGVRPIQPKPAAAGTEADARAEAEKIGRVLWVRKDPRAPAFLASIDGKFVALYDAEKRELERFDLFVELAVGSEVTARDAAFDAAAVWVGTDKGLFRYARADRGWNVVPVGGGLQDADVQRLAIDPDGRALRVTVRRASGGEESWRLRLADSAWERVP